MAAKPPRRVADLLPRQLQLSLFDAQTGFHAADLREHLFALDAREEMAHHIESARHVVHGVLTRGREHGRRFLQA